MWAQNFYYSDGRGNVRSFRGWTCFVCPGESIVAERKFLNPEPELDYMKLRLVVFRASQELRTKGSEMVSIRKVTSARWP